MTNYEPMEITIVTSDDGRSTWPEPTCNSEWSRIEKLQWRAGVIKARSGVEIRFNDRCTASGPGYHYEWPRLIGVNVRMPAGWSSSSQFDDSIDQYLRGIEDGANAVSA